MIWIKNVFTGSVFIYAAHRMYRWCVDDHIDYRNKPNHHIINGTFVNPFPSWKRRRLLNAFMWLLQRPWKQQTIPTEDILPVRIPQFNSNESDNNNNLNCTWIGHSTYVLEFGHQKTNVIIDPVFSHRASIHQKIGPKRFRRPACTVDELPRIDIVCISHNHCDHLDTNSVIQLHKKFDPVFYVPLGLSVWMYKTLGQQARVYELDWGQRISFNHDVSVTFVPAQHWSARNGFDVNASLWGGFGIHVKYAFDTYTVYFAGDTGYDKTCFDRVGKLLPNVILGIIPIGAYYPRWFMRQQHVDPAQAVQIALDTGSKKAIGCHWGTFTLTDEPIMEPPQLLREELIKRKLNEQFFTVMKHGETRTYLLTMD
jgi:N-acyl-phosphatidylethanolamine-hydrolysing phospholipase D